MRLLKLYSPMCWVRVDDVRAVRVDVDEDHGGNARVVVWMIDSTEHAVCHAADRDAAESFADRLAAALADGAIDVVDIDAIGPTP